MASSHVFAAEVTRPVGGEPFVADQEFPVRSPIKPRQVTWSLNVVLGRIFPFGENCHAGFDEIRLNSSEPFEE